jgi:hypothetical protein
MARTDYQALKDSALRDYQGGVASYTVDGESITVRSPEEFLKYIAYLDGQIAAQAGRSPVGIMKPRGNSAV